MRKLSPYLPAYIVTVKNPEWSVACNSLHELSPNDPLRKLGSIRDNLWDKKLGSRVERACIDLIYIEAGEEMRWQLSLRFLAVNVSEYQAHAAVEETAITGYNGLQWINTELVSTTHRERSFYTRRPRVRRLTSLPGAPEVWTETMLYGDKADMWKKWNTTYKRDLFIQFHGKYRLVFGGA